MITVSFFLNKDGLISGFQSEGHADAGEYGYDIVCSAVSALTINTVNAIENLTEARFEEEANEEGGFLKVILVPQSEEDRDSQLLLKALQLGINQMADNYPENLRIRHIER